MKVFLINIYYNTIRRVLRLKLTQRLIQNWFYKRWEKEAKQYAVYRNSSEKKEKPKLFWGSMPIISNKYWSNAMREDGYRSDTVMSHYFSQINNNTDYDEYFDNILAKSSWFWLLKEKQFLLWEFIVFDFLLKNYDIFHITCFGIFREPSQLAEKENYFFKLFGCKIILMPYGGDYYMYSKISDNSLKHGLLKSYPKMFFEEKKIEKNFRKWSNNADAVITGFQFDSVGRWDVLPCSQVIIDLKNWRPKNNYSNNDGSSEYVNIVHTPNHRGFKGTEFVIHAVEELKKEGIKINLLLIEGKKNEEVKKILSEDADILVEQLIFTGYAMSGIEGMAIGLPVLSNLENEYYTKSLRRYSYLNECSILSSSPENIKDNLRILVKNPQLRKELGIANRKYVEKYHSYTTAQYMFGKIYEKIWFNKEVDLMNLYHPLNKESYNNQSGHINHPLIENKLLHNF